MDSNESNNKVLNQHFLSVFTQGIQRLRAGSDQITTAEQAK